MITRQEWRKLYSIELGKPYTWGAESPGAYDCSGFARWALAQLNLDPPGDQTAEGLYRFFSLGRSRAISVAEEELGDLVFFGSDAGVNHIALAWDGGDMIEAGGGDRSTTSAAVARHQGAEVRIRSITCRHDLVAILRPTALSWPGYAAHGELESVAGYGHYENAPPLTEWLGNGCHMRLKRPFSYVQDSGRAWPVPLETVVDGASIPKVFWSLIGGPFEGHYRDAFIIHDYYCDEQSRPWSETHRVFYDAMLCSGVPLTRAKVMFYAVYRFGPRWTQGPAALADGFEAAEAPEAVPLPLPGEAFDAFSFEADTNFIVVTDPDPETIEAIADGRRAGSLETAHEWTALEGIAADTNAAWASRPLVQRLVEQQEAAGDATSLAAIGSLLSRYSSLVRDRTPAQVQEAALSFFDLKPKYEALYASCQIRAERKNEVAWYRQKLVQNRTRYEVVAARTGAPWWFIGVAHALEASLNFNGHLHNADPLVAKTLQVPKGRPPIWSPPNDWESSAVDPITFEKLAGLSDWNVTTALYRWESFNGFGYYPRNINSPYLWSFSNYYTKGKFVKDRVFDANSVSRQCGAAIMLRALENADVISL